MGNELVDIIEEQERLKAERRAREAAAQQAVHPLPPQTEAPPAPIDRETSVAAPPPVEPGPPRFQGINLEQRALISTLGNFELSEKEYKAIVTICLRILARGMRESFATVATTHGVDLPGRTGLTAMESNLPKTDETTPGD